LRRVYDRIVGMPFVYDRMRPLVVGGIDMSPVYAMAETTADDVVLDVGCGTGDALRYLSVYQRYIGFDIDERAIGIARTRYAALPGVTFEARLMTELDVDEVAPTVAVLMGLLHHLDDEAAVRLLRGLHQSGTVRRTVTQDIVFLEGQRLSNFYVRLDRGHNCRTPDAYRALARDAGWAIDSSATIRSHPTRGLAKYFVMVLTSQ
jgi:SAM-dependent methyltransferase